jgi:SpoVK/Ycf46/Vps4 family AAA+-type ATPase
LDKVDTALGRPEGAVGSTRPGRIDRVVELPPLDEAGRGKIARRILRDWTGQWEQVVKDGRGDTGAQFQERCARLALRLHYEQLQSAEGCETIKPARGAAAPAESVAAVAG